MNQIRRNLRNIYTGFRRVSAKWRVLPDFIILGAQKSGTSSLWYYLSQHPGIRMSIRKETHFFDFNYHQDLAWYRAYFPLQYKVKPGLVVGESTHYYLCHPHVKSRGKYLMHLSRFWEYFDKNQLLIIQSEKLFQDTAGSLAEIFQFLGLEDCCRIEDISVRNIGRYPKHVPPEVVDYLDSYFKEYNLALYKEIDQEFNW